MNVMTLNQWSILLYVTLSLVTSCKKTPDQENKSHSENTKEIHQGDLNQTSITSPVVFAKEMTTQLYIHYLEVKKHLVNGDTKKVKTAAKKMEKFLSMHNYSKSFEATANLIALTRDLQKQRDFFKTLTEEAETVFKSATIVSGEIYTQYCPMAFEGKGGYWLSDSKEIRNPYYGSKMLKCGTVKEITK